MEDNDKKAHIGSTEVEPRSKVNRKNIIVGTFIMFLLVMITIAWTQYQRNQQQERDRTAAIQRDNRNYNEYQQEINALLIRNDYKGVIVKANEYLRIGTSKKNTSKMNLTKGMAYYTLGDYNSALTAYKTADADAKVAKETAQTYSIHHGLGNTYLKMGEYAKAKQEYESVIAYLKTKGERANHIDILEFEGQVHILNEKIKAQQQ